MVQQLQPKAIGLMTVFEEGPDRNKALGIWGGIGGVGATSGLLIGGPITEVDAKLFERKPAPDPRDVIALQVAFSNGGTGQLASVRAAPAYWRVHVFGTKGWAEARDETTLTIAPNGQSPQTQTFPPADSLALLLEAFAESIELGTPFLVPTREMLDVVAAFEAAIGSLASRQPIAVRSA